MAGKKINKLLKSLGGKPVNLALKFSKTLQGNPVINGILLDVDEEYYYLGENVEITMVIPKIQVEMILDANKHEPVDSEEPIPRGTKIQ